MGCSPGSPGAWVDDMVCPAAAAAAAYMQVTPRMAIPMLVSFCMVLPGTDMCVGWGGHRPLAGASYWCSGHLMQRGKTIWGENTAALENK